MLIHAVDAHDKRFYVFVLKLCEKDMQLLAIRASIRDSSSTVYLTYKDRSTWRNEMLSTEIELPLSYPNKQV